MQRLADFGLLVALVGLVLVAAHDGSFGALDWEVGRLTPSAVLDAAQAGEVLVDHAAFATVASVAQALAADTEERALQVVVVLVGAVAAGPVPIQNFLYLVEGRLVDQGVVASGALMPLR